MSIPTYTLGYPPDGASLGQTKSTIRNNLDGTFETLAVDHVNNNGSYVNSSGGDSSGPAGYHTIIHEVPQASVNTLTGYNQVFSGVPGTLVVNGTTTSAIPANSDQQLYSLTGAGILSQLTGHATGVTSTASVGGYQWIGGVLIQWAQVVPTASPQTFTFPIAFPNAVFSIVTGVNSTQVSSANTSVNAVTTTNFQLYTTKTNATNFYIAIGN